MNPLDWTGPEFLRFYVPYCLFALGFAWALRRLWLNANEPAGGWTPGRYPKEQDVYLIALLRGGPAEVPPTLLGRLMAAGVIALEGDRIVVQREALDRRLAPLEVTALNTLTAGVPAHSAGGLVAQAAAPELPALREELERQGMVHTTSQRWELAGVLLLGLVLGPGLGLVKLGLALDRGRTNIGFLLLLIGLFTLLSFALLWPPRRTAAGKQYLSWLKESHQGLVQSVNENPQALAGDLALAASIYGIAALPMLNPLHAALRPPSSSSSSSGCGSSDSGGGDGGGGDGGGGGCGGGCGGCGGG